MAERDPFDELGAVPVAEENPAEDPFAALGAVEPTELAPVDQRPAAAQPFPPAKPGTEPEKPGFLERVGQGALGAATGIVQGAMLNARTPLDYAKAAGEYAYQNLTGTDTDFETALAEARADTARVEREAPIAHTVGQVGGAIGTAVGTGGLGTVKLGTQAAAKAGGALAARLGAAGVMTAQQASAVRIGSAVAGLVTAGAAAGAQQAVVRKVDEAVATGDYRGLAETIVPAVLEDAAKDAALDLGLGAAGAGLSAGVRKLVEAGASDWVSGRAFKAVLGGRNLKGVKLAGERFQGGPEAVGKAMLDEKIVTGPSSFDEIAERLAAKREEIGTALGAKRAQLGELLPEGDRSLSGADLWSHIDDQVIAPLRSDPSTRRVSRALEEKLSDLKDDLLGNADKGISPIDLSFDSLQRMRQGMDKVLNWERASGDVTLEAHRDVRRAFNNWLMDSAEKAAVKAGNPELVREIKSLNDRYAKIAFADGIAQEAIDRALANRFISPSDYGMGAMAAVADAASGGAYSIAKGAAGALANKVARERGNPAIAGYMYRLSNRLVKTQERIQRAASLPRLIQGAAAVTSAQAATRPAAAFTPAMAEQRQKRVSKDLRYAEALLDPETDEHKELTGTLQGLELEAGPDVASAARDHAMKRAQFIVDKAPPTPQPGVFEGQPKRELSDDDVETLHRYMDAVDDPQSALQRIGDGESTAEDVETMSTLYPSMLQDFRREAAQTLSQMKSPPPYEERLALAETLGMPLTPDSDPTALAYWQSISFGSAAERKEQQGPSTRSKPVRTYEQPADKVLSTADRIA